MADWVKANELALNISKIKSIVFGLRNINGDAQLHLFMSGLAIEEVKSTQLLV